ncbi:MAG: hypothetical protein KIT17_23295 [Rubrivivax sp.]|nr:hypothetical protein [Rubrivivax sp.]
MNATSPAAPPVLAVLEDCGAGVALIECSAALARALGRELALVQVQSTLALQAAALPPTQVLAVAGTAWAPLAPTDIERAWRAQAARLQALAGATAARHALRWSLRAVRGEVGEVARRLSADSDLLFLDARGVAEPHAWRPPPAARHFAVADDGSEAVQRALQLAHQLAALLPQPLARARASVARCRRPTPGWRGCRPPIASARCRAMTAARWPRLVRLGTPVLLVG